MKSLLDPMDRFLFFPLSLSLSLLISRVENHMNEQNTTLFYMTKNMKIVGNLSNT